MTNVDIADQLIELVASSLSARKFVSELDDDIVCAVAPELRKRAIFYLRSDAITALQIADLIVNIGEWQELPLVCALGYQTKAIASTLSQREFEEALVLFAKSETIFKRYNAELEIAVGQVSRIWALACLQRYDEAFEASVWTTEVLTDHQDYRSLAALNNNLAAIYGRRGQDRQALDLLRQVEAAYERLGSEGEQRIPFALINQAIVLRNLGRFQESIFANEKALDLAISLDQKATAARAEQNLGITYFLTGHINKAQALLQKARDTFLADNRNRDAIMTELFVSDGLLHLRRYEDVLEICQRVKETFRKAGTQFEVAQALLNEATALTGLYKNEEAVEILAQARQVFVDEKNEAWHAYTDFEEAAILYRQAKYEKSADLALKCVDKLHALNLPLREAHALMIAAQASLAQKKMEEAGSLLKQALFLTQSINVPALSYRAHYLQGRLYQVLDDADGALSAYDTAIIELERLQGRIMVEFRADFLADKDEVYKQAVDLCIRSNKPKQALLYAERAKSRALLAMLSHHVDLRIEAKSEADQDLVDQILDLREKRDRLYRRWETGETEGSMVNWDVEQISGQAAHRDALNEILVTEDKIRTLWHQLLISNTAYTRDASLWQVHSDLDQQVLEDDTLLVEYYELPEALVVFLISAEEVKTVRLPVTLDEIETHQQKLIHNFNTLKKLPHRANLLADRANDILQDIYSLLVKPWIHQAEDYLKLIIVPHGPLHYLPFHALFNGQEYLLQRFQISYLPGSSFLQRVPPAQPKSTEKLVMGHTYNGRLKNVMEEVELIAETLDTNFYLNAESTRHRFQEESPGCQVIHVAAHGDFKPSNPLFSGLYLSDGLLTTLDIFNMKLQASLVTLSACQTGRNLVGGGDELFGLTRAFLTAGTSSLILTLWPVEDQSTSILMQKLYQNLQSGLSKIESLQNAQRSLISGSGHTPAIHPYYWAPFFLIGEPGKL